MLCVALVKFRVSVRIVIELALRCYFVYPPCDIVFIGRVICKFCFLICTFEFQERGHSRDKHDVGHKHSENEMIRWECIFNMHTLK